MPVFTKLFYGTPIALAGGVPTGGLKKEKEMKVNQYSIAELEHEVALSGTGHTAAPAAIIAIVYIILN